ncbi:hypothetical protein M0802_004479 [Mischocyttarus mexicanus]|nr:hypothetical protein M0802_004479 [Mischocyttarus mexicanus]
MIWIILMQWFKEEEEEEEGLWIGVIYEARNSLRSEKEEIGVRERKRIVEIPQSVFLSSIPCPRKVIALVRASSSNSG